MGNRNRSRKTSRTVRPSRRQAREGAQINQLAAQFARVGSVVAPPLVTLHDYANETILFVNGTERMRVPSGGVPRIATLLTELQREGAVRIEAMNFSSLATHEV